MSPFGILVREAHAEQHHQGAMPIPVPQIDQESYSFSGLSSEGAVLVPVVLITGL